MTSQPDPTATLSLEHQRESFITGQFLRIVNWHNTPETRRLTLRAELTWYLERYHPIGPDDLDRFFDTGTWHLGRPAFLPAFYDGYRNNATVAAPVCDELGLTAWFFPPTGFLDTPAEEQLAYTTTNDIILLDDEEPEGPWAMTWDDLAMISRRHVVAAHTANHAAARHIVTAEDVEREITTPIRRIQELTGRTPPAFAFLSGTPPVPGTLAGDAVLASGVRYATTNTSYVRIAD